MRYVAAYLLAVLGGNNAPSAKDIEKILGSVGVEVEAENVKKVINELKGKSIEELIEEGSSKLASMPAGGGGAAAPAAAAAPAEEKKEEKKKEESEEEEDDDMGFGLFD